MSMLEDQAAVAKLQEVIRDANLHIDELVETKKSSFILQSESQKQIAATLTGIM